MSLDVDIQEREAGSYLVKPEGRLDSDTYTMFEQRIKPLLTAYTKVLMFDMRELEYISSAGLGVVFAAKKEIESHGGSFLMTHLQPQIKKVFEIVKALPDKSVFANIEEADAYLDYMQKKEKEKFKGPTEL